MADDSPPTLMLFLHLSLNVLTDGPLVARPFAIRVQLAFSEIRLSLNQVASLRPPLPPWYYPAIACDPRLNAYQEPCTALCCFKNASSRFSVSLKTIIYFTLTTQEQLVLLEPPLSLAPSRNHSSCPTCICLHFWTVYHCGFACTHKKVLHKKTLICSDPLSALTSLCALVCEKHIFLDGIHTLLGKIQIKGWVVQFLWEPGNVGIAGNNQADQVAKHGPFENRKKKHALTS